MSIIKDIIGIKLGGSDITEKNPDYFPLDILQIIESGIKYIKVHKIEKTARVLCHYLQKREHRIVLVHGAGPFGHELVEKVAPRIIHMSMQYLNLVISSILEKENVPVKPVSPFDFCKVISDRKQFQMDYLIDEVIRIVDSGQIPICYGDMAPFIDCPSKYGVVSGDNILPAIGYDSRVKMIKMIMLSKNQIYNRDPAKWPEAYPINKIIVDTTSFEEKMNELAIHFEPNPKDKSESMAGKAKECYQFTQKTHSPSIIAPFQKFDEILQGGQYGTLFTWSD